MRYRDNLPLVSANGIRMIYMLGLGIALQLYLKDMGASPFQVSLLEVTFWAALFIFAPLWGALSDASGRRKVFLATSIVAAGAVIPAFTVLDTVTGVLLLRFGFAALASAFPPVALAAMSASADQEHRAKNLAPYNTSRALGFLIGWGTSGLLIDTIGFAQTFTTLGLVGVAGFIATLLIDRDSVDAPEPVSAQEVWNNAKQRWLPSVGDTTLQRHGLHYLYTGIFLRKAGLIGTMSLIAVYATDHVGLSASLMGLLLALNPLSQFLFITLFGRLTDIYGRKKITLFGFLFTVPVPLLLILANDPVWLATGMAKEMLFGGAYLLLGFSFAAVVEGTTAFVGDVAPDGRQGEFMGFRKSAQGLAGITGPLIAGGLATVYGFTVMLSVMTGLMVLAFLSILFGTDESLHESGVHESVAQDVVARVHDWQ
jgi:MFS family permease